MVWFEIIPSLVLTAGPLLLVAAPTIYIGNWYFLNGKVGLILLFIFDN
jgi:cbb3-type cytochrome oxidase subunit 1